MENRFDIILVSFNRLDYLKRTVASLLQSRAIHECERFIIVDNASTEEGVKEFLEDLKRTFRAYLVLLPENKGWGTAVNIGLCGSRAPFLFLLNNDVEFTFEFYKKMLSILEKPILLPPGREAKGIGILGGWRHIHHGVVQNNAVFDADFTEMDNVPAVCWLLPKSAMEVVGMLPEHGPCDTKGGNGEDTGYVLHMKEAGFLIGVPTEILNEDLLAHHIDGY